MIFFAAGMQFSIGKYIIYEGKSQKFPAGLAIISLRPQKTGGTGGTKNRWNFLFTKKPVELFENRWNFLYHDTFFIIFISI